MLNIRPSKIRTSLIIGLPDIPKCEYLKCSNNQIINLPDLPNCRMLNCLGNPIVNPPKIS